MLFKLIKQYFVRKWAKEISTRAVGSGTVVDSKQRNLMGDGGIRRPYYVSWSTLLNQCKDPDAIVAARAKKYLAVKEYLFFAYFGPLEYWCEHNFTDKFMLWYDDNGIYCMPLTDQDQMLWMLSWNGTMPSLEDMQTLS